MLNTEIPKHIFLASIGICIVVGLALGVTFIRHHAAKENDTNSAPYYVFPETDQAPMVRKTDPQDTGPIIPPPKQNDNTFCIQVTTPAINTQTKEVRDFPTPCDVPGGWEPLTE